MSITQARLVVVSTTRFVREELRSAENIRANATINRGHSDNYIKNAGVVVDILRATLVQLEGAEVAINLHSPA